MPRRVAILFHENHRRHGWQSFVISYMARCWAEAGHLVTFVFGIREFVPADLAILHVDLSVVPPEYLEFARRYPLVLNGAVTDVRKSTISRNLVGAGDPYEGSVIVKSDLNFAGLPEQLLTQGGVSLAAQLGNLCRSLRGAWRGVRPSRFRTSPPYRIYRSLREVPPACFTTPGLVVEKFLPERDEGLYWLRVCQFLGDRMTWSRIAAPHPIVKIHDMVRQISIDPDPEIVAVRRTLRMDYGKLDYVVHDGRAILLDVNKTPGEGRRVSAASMARIRYRAAGLDSYFT